MIAIITDSSSNITQSEARELGITVLPLTIVFGMEEYLDGIDIDSAEFYKKLTIGKDFPHTAQLTEEQVEKAVVEARRGADEVLILPISSALSGSYDRCVKIAEKYEGVYAYDGKCTTVMLKMLTLIAVKNADKPAKEVIKILSEYRPKIKLYAALNTLEYLGKGGRISKTVATLGNVLKIKPVVTVNDDGEVELISKQFGMNKSLAYIADQVKKDKIDYDEPIIVIYSMTQENSDRLIEKIGVKYSEMSEICAVIATHIGPHAAGFVYVNKAN